MVFGIEPGGPVSFEQKRRNSIKVKDEIMKQLTGSGYAAPEKPWDAVSVTVSEELQRVMDDRLITMSDVKETIWTSEKNSEFFRDNSSDTVLCRMVTPMLTYWVEYRLLDGVYELIDVYSHRMHFKEGV